MYYTDISTGDFSVVFQRFRLCRRTVPLSAISPHHLLEPVNETRVAFTKANIRAGRVANEPSIWVVSAEYLPIEFYDPTSPVDGAFEWIILNGVHVFHAVLQIITEDSASVNNPSTSYGTSQHALSHITVEVYHPGELISSFTNLLH